MTAGRSALSRPIIIVGVERSGTTLLYSLLANHDDLYWLSRLDSLLPGLPAACCLVRRVASRAWRGEFAAVPGAISRSSGLIPPSECQPYWRRLFRWGSERDYLIEDDHFDETMLDAETKRAVRADFDRRARLSGKSRLLVKQTSLALKIRYLDALFPDGLFLHILRHPTENLASLQRAKLRSGERFWGTKIPGWRELCDEDLELQAAVQMNTVLEIMERDAETLSDRESRLMRVKYEELVRRPVEKTSEVLAFCGLEPSERVRRAAAAVRPRRGAPAGRSAPRRPEARRIVDSLASRYYRSG